MASRPVDGDPPESHGNSHPAAYSFPSKELRENPFPFYEALRREAPVYRLPGRDEYLVSRWEDIEWVAAHPEIFGSAPREADSAHRLRPELKSDGPRVFSPRSMGHSDPPEHKAKRRLGLLLMTPAKLREYEPMIERIVDELLDSIAQRGSVELNSEFSRLVPLHAICEILGLSREHAPMFLRWAENDEHQGSRFLSAQRVAAQRRHASDAVEFLRSTLAERLENPGQDGLSELVAAQVARDGVFDLPYLVAESHMLLAAGMITTAHMLTSTVQLLLQHPDELLRLRADPALVRGVIEESLRLETPTQWNHRMVREDVRLGEVSIPKGSVVLLVWAAGNRDDAKFAEPERLWSERPLVAKSQLAFGRGIHTCLGAPLARLEGRIAIGKLVERFPNMRYAPGKNDFTHIDSVIMRTLKELHLEV
jgi:cytochrome P450